MGSLVFDYVWLVDQGSCGELESYLSHFHWEQSLRNKTKDRLMIFSGWRVVFLLYDIGFGMVVSIGIVFCGIHAAL